MYAIQTKDLTKRYRDTTAVDGLNLAVRRGELLCLLGVNGAGKTTTVKLLSGLVRPTCGDAFLLGKSITHKAQEIKRSLGVSPQESAVAPNLTARENLALMCGVFGLKKEEKKQKIDALSKRLALSSFLDKRASKLSGGMVRRLSIAMALVGDPEILFLDEPTLGLDVLSRSDLWELVRELKGDVTIVLTTHYMEEAETLSDRVAILKEGRLLLCDTAEKIKEIAGEETFEKAFIRIAKEGVK